jgi:hypothetical protein
MDTHYYELHVTILPQRILEFASFCKELNAKPLYIQLDRGIHKNQPMLAVTTMLPDDRSAKGWARDYAEVVQEHFPVVRTKLESRLTEGPNEYYEAHWKLDFPFGDSDLLLDALVKGKPHLLRSHNLFDSRIQYLSQRIYSSSDPLVASSVFNGSDVQISFGGLPLVKTHYERCVWDSNPALDYGWE